MSDPALDAVVTHVRVEILFRELEDLVPQLEEAAKEASNQRRPTARAAKLKADVIKVLRDALEELED
jgi:hypothetical protein